MPDPMNYPIPAVVFDWAGTTIDHGSLAPVRTLQRVFASRDIGLDDSVIRRDMGLAKRDHIRRLLAEPEVRQAWQKQHHRIPDESDVDALYQDFIPLQTACLQEFATVIDGVVPVVNELRSRGVRIGGTTGYTRSMLEALEQAARAQGYFTDSSVCPEDVSAGRPLPLMCYRLALDLHAAPLSSCVKVGDTLSDIDEGRNAGMWTIGVMRTGNMVGLSADEWAALPEPEQQSRLSAASSQLLNYGANFVVATVADILPAIDIIAGRISSGEQPN
jgi:phosphonoacetaldehyde hydrolase